MIENSDKYGAAGIDPTSRTMRYRIFRAFPDTLNGLKAMHLLSFQPQWMLDCHLHQTIELLSRRDGSHLNLFIIRPHGFAGILPVVIYLHGGGYAIGSPQQEFPTIARLINRCPAVFVLPRYRRSFEAAFPAALDDCHDALKWVLGNADIIGGNRLQIMVMGSSAGGGLATALALKSPQMCDHSIKAQVLVAAMLDHQTESKRQDLSWSAKKNSLAWGLYLRNGANQTLGYSCYAAPAHATNLKNMPPAFGIVGNCDLFYRENHVYFDRLASAGNRGKLQIIAGAYHGVDILAPKSVAGKAFRDAVDQAYMEALDSIN